MPNHCENDLYICGSAEDVAAALALIGADQDPPRFDFNALIPYPERLAQMDAEANAFAYDSKLSAEERTVAKSAYAEKWGTTADGFNSVGYEWRREHWGTKWGAYNVSRRDRRGVCVSYRTAWAPSRQAVVALAARFPTLTIHAEYYETGAQFCGGWTCPSKSDCDDSGVEWSPGVVTDEWTFDGYRGHRGG